MNKPGWLYRFARSIYLKFIDQLTRKHGVKVRVNDFEFRVPGRFSRYYPSDYENANFEFLRANLKPGIIAIDIGAHLGIYSIRLAQLGASKVYAFEPTPSTSSILKKVIHLNHFEDRISVRTEAIGEHSGKAVFHINSPIDDRDKMSVSEANSLKYIDHGNQIAKNVQTVEIISLDELLSDQQARGLFLKVDAEGAELDILRGAIKTFKTAKPSGIISIHCFTYADRQSEMQRLWDLIRELGINPLFENKPIDRERLMTLGKTDIFDLQFTVS